MKTEAVNCNCINKPICLLCNQCQITNIIYRTSEGTFKQRYGNHKKSFSHEKHRADAELSKEYWRLKEIKAKLQVQFYILKRCWPKKRQGICYLCLNKYIIEHQGNNFLNQRNELISKCRHKNKFKLMKYKTWALCWTCLLLGHFSGVNFFPNLGWIWTLKE